MCLKKVAERSNCSKKHALVVKNDLKVLFALCSDLGGGGPTPQNLAPQALI